jgi:uncharacterized protein (TIGR03905 family)
MAIYRTRGSCSREIIFSVNENHELTSLKFLGGCSGNHQALTRLLIGKDINYIIGQLKGIRCRNNTSCPDQLSQALERYLEEKDSMQE